MTEQPNPYAPPKHDGAAPTSGDASLEAIRREHINAETNVKTIGFLLYLGAGALVLGALSFAKLEPVGALVNLLLGGVFGLAGYWLRRLDRRGRLVYTAVAALVIAGGLFFGAGPDGANTLGALFWPILLLAVLWVQKASTVMTPHYRDVVIPATPHVKRKTSAATIVLIIILLSLMVGIVVFGTRS